MNMIPFHNICKPNYLVIQFKAHKNILMLENYCSDPDCSCNEVLLNFAQLNEENKITNNLLNLKIDMISGTILEKTILDPLVDAAAILKEFSQHFEQFQDHLKQNNEKVKDYYSKYQGTELPNEVVSLIEESNCVDYQKLFGEINQITFNFQGESYLIRDQYCMKPTCSCNEVIMVVYKQDAKLSDFVFRFDLLNEEHEILKINNDNDHESIINYITEYKKIILKARYNRMKEVGNHFLL